MPAGNAGHAGSAARGHPGWVARVAPSLLGELDPGVSLRIQDGLAGGGADADVGELYNSRDAAEPARTCPASGCGRRAC